MCLTTKIPNTSYCTAQYREDQKPHHTVPCYRYAEYIPLTPSPRTSFTAPSSPFHKLLPKHLTNFDLYRSFNNCAGWVGWIVVRASLLLQRVCKDGFDYPVWTFKKTQNLSTVTHSSPKSSGNPPLGHYSTILQPFSTCEMSFFITKIWPLCEKHDRFSGYMKLNKCHQLAKTTKIWKVWLIYICSTQWTPSETHPVHDQTHHQWELTACRVCLRPYAIVQPSRQGNLHARPPPPTTLSLNTLRSHNSNCSSQARPNE